MVSGVGGSHGESPAMFKKDGTYFFLFSNLTSWEKNDNFYFTAPSVKGPWTRQGLFAPEGSLTYNSQTTFVFPLKCGEDTIPMFMGDRWLLSASGFGCHLCVDAYAGGWNKAFYSGILAFLGR